MVSRRSPAGIKKPPTHRLIGLQLLVTVVAAATGGVLFGQVAAKSALFGGLIAVVPNMYFAWRAFAYNQTRSAARVVGSFYQAELGKLALTALLFAVAFKFAQTLQPVALFTAFGAVMVSGLIGSATMLSKTAG